VAEKRVGGADSPGLIEAQEITGGQLCQRRGGTEGRCCFFQ
jgi:hypothetical protein